MASVGFIFPGRASNRSLNNGLLNDDHGIDASFVFAFDYGIWFSEPRGNQNQDNYDLPLYSVWLLLSAEPAMQK